MNILSILLLFALVVQIVLSKANRFHGYLFMLFSSLLLIPKGIFVISSSLKYYYLAVSFFFLFAGNTKSTRVAFPKAIGLAFGGYMLLSLFIIIGGSISYLHQLFYLFKQWFPILMFAYITFGLFCRNKYIERFNRALCFITIALCLYGIFEYLSQLNPYMSFMGRYFKDIDSEEEALLYGGRGLLTGRITCTMGHFLTWGQTLVLTLGYLFLVRNKIEKKLLYITILLVAINIIFTGSRSSVVPMLILLLGFVIRKAKYCIASLLLLFVLGNVPFNQKIQNTVDSFIFFWSEKKSHQDEMGGSSMELRAFQLETSLMVAEKNSLLFGQGLGYMETNQYAIVQRVMIGAECLIFPIIMQQGLLGVVAWLLLYIALFVIIEKKYKRAYGIYSLYLGVFFFGYFTSLIMTGDRQTFVWFMVLYAVYFRSLQFIKK